MLRQDAENLRRPSVQGDSRKNAPDWGEIWGENWSNREKSEKMLTSTPTKVIVGGHLKHKEKNL